MTGWQFDATIPAIVRPIVHHPNPYENPRFDDLFILHAAGSPGSQGAIDWIVVVLDRNALEQKIFPALAKRYFADQRDLDYEVAVTTQGPSARVLYASDPDLARRGSA